MDEVKNWRARKSAVDKVPCLGRKGISLRSTRRLGSCVLHPVYALLLSKQTRAIGSHLNFIQFVSSDYDFHSGVSLC